MFNNHFCQLQMFALKKYSRQLYTADGITSIGMVASIWVVQWCKSYVQKLIYCISNRLITPINLLISNTTYFFVVLALISEHQKQKRAPKKWSYSYHFHLFYYRICQSLGKAGKSIDHKRSYRNSYLNVTKLYLLLILYQPHVYH